MPELPEVETVCRGIAPALVGGRIKHVQQNRPNLRYPFPDGFASELEGREVSAVRRRSKYILIDFKGGITVVVHLGMSGSFRVYSAGDEYVPQKHDHFIWLMEGGQRLVYHDPRRFGFVLMFDGDALEQDSHFRDLGPEPLSNAFYAAHLFDKMHRSRSSVKSLLLNQKVVAGLGNIYVCEVLYRCGVHPEVLGNEVSLELCEEMVRHIRQVLREAIEAGGSSLKDYRQADGEMGYFQHAFKVYGREGEPCGDVACDCRSRGGVVRVVQSGRSSFYCPVKQVR